MHVLADSVAAHVADDAVSVCFGELLDGGTDVAQTSADDHVVDASVEAVGGHFDEVFSFVGDVANADGFGVVALPSVEDEAAIDGKDFAVLEFAIAGDSVHHFVVNGCA